MVAVQTPEYPLVLGLVTCISYDRARRGMLVCGVRGAISEVFMQSGCSEPQFLPIWSASPVLSFSVSGTAKPLKVLLIPWYV